MSKNTNKSKKTLNQSLTSYYSIPDEDLKSSQKSLQIKKNPKQNYKPSKSTKKSQNSHRKVVISKMSKPSKSFKDTKNPKDPKEAKESAKKGSKTSKHKSFKIKKPRHLNNQSKQLEKVNHSINMNLAETSLCNDDHINKSYQQDYHFEGSFTKNIGEDLQQNIGKDSQEISIHGEIEYQPKQPENGVQELQQQEWENIEMFSSKKFSDILRKHKKVIRYQDSEFNEEESLMEIQSNRRSINNLQEVDIGEDEEGLMHHHTYEKPLSRENFDGVLQPPQDFNKIRKVENHHMREISNQGEMRMEELKTFQNQSRDHKVVENHSIEFSESEQSENKIFTASINLLDKDIFSDEKQQEIVGLEEKAEDRDDSLEKPPNWDFAGPQKEGFFEGNVTSKRVIVDDLEDFQYEDPVPYDGTGGSGHDVLENASVFDQENPGVDPDQIPFNIEEDYQQEKNDQEFEKTDTQEEDKDTLKQMRILFGSEQRIREQSEAAIKNLDQDDLESDHNSEPDEFLTPGISQHEESKKISSRVFGKQSFQDFSRKKFQEIMFDSNISEFMNSVERTVRETVGESKTYRKLEEKAKDYTSFTPKKPSFASPRKFNRKELELDSIVGNKMKFMSEKKKARKSMLENYDSSLIKDFPQDPFNVSQEVYKAKFANFNTKKSNEATSQRASIERKSGPIIENIEIQENLNKKVDVERTDQVFIKSKLQSSNEIKNNSAQEPESIRRSNVRGLEVMISEKSQEMDIINNILQIDQNEDDDNNTLKYDLTEEHTEKRSLDESSKNKDNSKSKDSPKDIMYDQLEKIMGS